MKVVGDKEESSKEAEDGGQRGGSSNSEDTFQECSHSREPKAQEKSSKMISHWVLAGL